MQRTSSDSRTLLIWLTRLSGRPTFRFEDSAAQRGMRHNILLLLLYTTKETAHVQSHFQARTDLSVNNQSQIPKTLKVVRQTADSTIQGSGM